MTSRVGIFVKSEINMDACFIIPFYKHDNVGVLTGQSLHVLCLPHWRERSTWSSMSTRRNDQHEAQHNHSSNHSHLTSNVIRLSCWPSAGSRLQTDNNILLAGAAGQLQPLVRRTPTAMSALVLCSPRRESRHLQSCMECSRHVELCEIRLCDRRRQAAQAGHAAH